MKQRNTLTSEQDAEFDARMRHWQARLGLLDWRLVRGSRKTTAMADVKINYGSRLASYVTGNFGAEGVSSETIDAVARHEALHVLLADLIHVAGLAEPDAVTLEAAEHRIVNVLEKLLGPL